MKSWLPMVVAATALASLVSVTSGWPEAWVDVGCEFACCSCCPSVRCRCGLGSADCARAHWEDIGNSQDVNVKQSIVKWVVIGMGILGFLIMGVSILRDIPELPRRTRAVNPIGHSEGSLCLLHAYQEPPDPTHILVLNDKPGAAKPDFHLAAVPTSLVNLLPIRNDLGWVRDARTHAPTLPSPMEAPAAHATALTWLPTKLFLVGADWNDRRSVLSLTPEDVDNL